MCVILKNLFSRYLNRPDNGPKKASAKKDSKRTADIDHIQQQLRSMLGLPVHLNYKNDSSGDIRIPFKNDKELNYILDLLDEIDKTT